MPCRVDLFPVYEYYDSTDRADYLFFRTPLVPFLCEAMKLIQNNNLTEDLNILYREAMIKWKEYHDLDDKEKEINNKKLNPFEHKDVMDYFTNIEKKLLTK